ncbi:unnamed protein product [Trifolium pratense]|uniref:Uncharacterized protein n=1 Tax=Trifolium pratense TaxID=57577 RepID=A0ACB0JLA4_TRIPR|nr:unnamed protein product [Trifolium pratense]
MRPPPVQSTTQAYETVNVVFEVSKAVNMTQSMKVVCEIEGGRGPSMWDGMPLHTQKSRDNDLHSGHHLVEDQTATEKQIDTPVKKFGTKSDSKLRRSYIECQHIGVYNGNGGIALKFFALDWLEVCPLREDKVIKHNDLFHHILAERDKETGL